MSDRDPMNVPIARTALSESEIESVLGPLRSGWLVQGPNVREFEAKWSAFTGAAQSIAVTSCTTGLHLAAVALGLGPEDEVVVPAFTWIATANIVEHQQAKVVFCDIDLETFNLDPASLAAAVTPRTRGLIPVHLFGLSSTRSQSSTECGRSRTRHAASARPIMAATWAR
jgi:perosamine synthetase